MHCELWDIDRPQPYPNNPRINDKAVGAVAASIRQFGFRQPIVVDREEVIVIGHTRLIAARRLGLTKVPVHVASDLSPEQVRALRIADNKTADLADWDMELLPVELREIKAGGWDLEELGFSERELEKLLGDEDDADEPGGKAEELDEAYSVLVKCASEGQQKAILKELTRHDLDVRALCIGFPKPESAEPPPPPAVAGEIDVVREVKIHKTPRVLQMAGMFDVPLTKKTSQRWRIKVDLTERPWQIGLIVGPSGCGKSAVAGELFGDRLVKSWQWPADKSILDGFPESLTVAEVVGFLSSVGFSSPPGWVKPFHVLSNGEKFRVELARTLAEGGDLAVVDEFTSVVDRQVAQIGSAAVAKAVRASGRRFVAVSCHFDIEEWLQPDWKLEPASGEFTWRSLRRRPDIQLHVRRARRDEWALFRGHHYLSADLHRAARCFIGEVGGRPAAFVAVLYFPHVNGGWWREHRAVCLPDFQGVGIGNAMSEYVASLYAATGREYRSTTSHPAMIRHRLRSPQWMMVRAPSLNLAKGTNHVATNRAKATTRMTAGFTYMGPDRSEDAARFGVLKADPELLSA